MAERPEPAVARSRRSSRSSSSAYSQSRRRRYAGASGGTSIELRSSTTAAIGAAGAVRDPDAAALAHERVERDRHAAGRRPRADRSVRARTRESTARDWTRRPGRRRDPPISFTSASAARNTIGPMSSCIATIADHQRLEPAAPVGILRRDDDRQAERDARRRTAARARRRCDSRRREPGARARRRGPRRATAPRAGPTTTSAVDANRRQRLDVHRRADRGEEQHEAPASPRAGLASRRTSPASRNALRTTRPAASPASSGSKCRRAAEAGDDRAQREQHDGDFAADVADVEREQRIRGCAPNDSEPTDRPGGRGRERPPVRPDRSRTRGARRRG